jgi:spermidine/putrescine ABC transporter ATP-binding subunit
MSNLSCDVRPTEFEGRGSGAARLEMIGLEKRYGDVVAAKDLNLVVEPGEFMTLLGPSGSGKSTTLAMVAGFENPSSGSIVLGGRDITRLVTHKRGLGMVFQGYALFPHMSVFDNVAFPLTVRRTEKTHLRRRVMEALEAVSLEALAQRRPTQLSGGQQQRVALARAFVHRPPILLMDEPLSALDKALRTQMQVEIRRLHREIGTTVLFVTHDQEEALGLSDRVVVMNDGEIEQCGTPTEVYESPQTEFVAGFLGAANFLEGSLRNVGHALAEVSLKDGRIVEGRITGPVYGSDAVRVVLRPEDGVLTPPSGEEHNHFRVHVTELLYLGERIRCIGAFADGIQGSFWLHHCDADKVRVGQDVDLYWPHSRTVFVEKQTDAAAG